MSHDLSKKKTSEINFQKSTKQFAYNWSSHFKLSFKRAYFLAKYSHFFTYWCVHLIPYCLDGICICLSWVNNWKKRHLSKIIKISTRQLAYSWPSPFKLSPPKGLFPTRYVCLCSYWCIYLKHLVFVLNCESMNKVIGI